MLRELGVHPVGKRVKILKAIRRLKIDNNIPLDTEGDELMNSKDGSESHVINLFVLELESMYSEELGENIIVNERITTNEFLQLEEALYKRGERKRYFGK